MRRILVDYNTREFIRPGVQSVAVLERMNPEMKDTWRPTIGEDVLLVDHDGCEFEGRTGRGERFAWVADI